MAMKNWKRTLKICALGALLVALLLCAAGCLIRPDSVNGGNTNANPTMLVFQQATPVPIGLSSSEPLPTPTVAAATDGSWQPGTTIATEPPSAMVTFSIGGNTVPLETSGIGIAGIGVGTAEPTATPTTEPALKKGATGSRVTALQEQLKQLGYYTGKVDGSYGDGTVKAVKAFQSRNGLTADGVAGAATLRLLESGSAKKAATPTPKPTPTPTSSALRLGSTGSKVKSMQQKLKNLGYYTGSVDGTFGEGTQKAVKAFQKANGLTADGVAGTATLNKLNSSSAKSAVSESSKATARPAMRTYVPSTLSTYRYLQQGSRGSDVTKLQQRLKDLGYFSGSVNGSFGADTETAVRAFQKRNGLWEDGVAGEDTQRMLYSNNALAASR